MIERYKKMEYTVKQIAEFIGVTKPTVQTAIKKLNIQPLRTDNINRAFYSLNDTTLVIRTIKPDFNISTLIGTTEKPQSKPQSTPPNTTNNFSVILQNDIENSLDQEENRKKEAPKTEKQNRQNEENINVAAATEKKGDYIYHYLSFLEEQIRSKDQQIETAFKQISEKDKQIEEKDKQIQELLNRLTQSMDLTKGLQYITAADKTTQMLQANGGAVQRQDQEQQQEPQEQEVQTAVKIQDQAEPQQKKKKNNLLHRLFNKS